jgi:hypothetical protein
MLRPYGTTSGRKARESLNRNFIGTRFPHRSDVIAVLSIAVFVCFSWSIIGFFNKLSSFLLYFKPAEIAAIFAYMMAFALLESLVSTGLLVLLSALLPSSWLRDGFAYKGFVILVIATADALALQKSLGDVFPPTRTLLLLSIVPLVLIVILLVALRSTPRLQSLLLNVQDRFLILLFVYLPIGIISLIAVTFRNLL